MVRFLRRRHEATKQNRHRPWGRAATIGDLLTTFALSLALLTSPYAFAQADAIDSQGHEIHLSDYKGKWLLVNYWAEWCHACLKEMPDLVQLQAKYPNKVALIGVNFDEKPNEYLNHFMSEYRVNFTMTAHLDPQLLGLTTPMATVPTTVLIDPQGKVSKVILQPKVLFQWEQLMALSE